MTRNWRAETQACKVARADWRAIESDPLVYRMRGVGESLKLNEMGLLGKLDKN